MINSPLMEHTFSTLPVFITSIHAGNRSIALGPRTFVLRRVSTDQVFNKIFTWLKPPVSNPWTVSSNFSQRQIISVPSEPWEKTPYGRSENVRLSSNEGPEQLTNPATGQQFIIYSAARSDNRNYCLGQLELVGEDPMNVQDWRKTTSGCVFYQNPMKEVYGVGHASFTKSPDGKEDWIVSSQSLSLPSQFGMGTY